MAQHETYVKRTPTIPGVDPRQKATKIKEGYLHWLPFGPENLKCGPPYTGFLYSQWRDTGSSKGAMIWRTPKDLGFFYH